MSKAPATGAESVRWNLSALYKGVGDPTIDADVTEWIDRAKAFHAAHKGKLAETLGQAIRDYSELSMLSGKTGAYLFLLTSVNTGDAAAKAKMAELDKATSQASAEYLEFFTLELVDLDDAVIAAQAAKDETVKKHLPWLKQVRLFKPHVLTEVVESALTKRSPFGAGSWSEFFDEVEADLRFAWKGEELSLTEILHLMTEDPDTTVRAAMLKALNDGLGGMFAKYSAQTLYMVAGSGEVEDKDRKYAHPMDSRNKSSQLPDAVVDALHKAVTEKAGPLAQRFYRLKAGILGKKVLAWSDRNAPMPFADTTVMPWTKAMDIVLSAYRSFSPTLAALVEQSAANGWIDAPAMKGRRGGAYNYSISLPGNLPISFTFLNYLGSGRDIMTVAHELGHGVHGLLAGEAQGTLMAHAPIALCETASVFGEMTTFNYLMSELDKSGDKTAKLALLMDKLNDITNTVVRQIGFSNFERRLHGWNPETESWGPVAKRSADEIDTLWQESLYPLYGQPDEVFSYEHTSHLWAYISHFHRPFYVYGYAFGELLTQSLYAARPRLGEKFEPLYLEMLRAGGTKDAKELLAPFGLDPTSATFWEEGIKVSMERLITEAETLTEELGLTT